jgi:ESS family glutamate:Na+ symporter
MTFWEFEISFYESFMLLGILIVVFLLANVIRRKVGFIRNSLLPTAVIGGILMLVLKILPVFDGILNDADNNHFLEAITYHTLALGFIAIALKTMEKQKSKHRQREIMDAGLVTVNMYLIQGLVGIALTIAFSVLFMKELLPASGLLLPMGFGQGTGQALNFGTMFENNYDFAGGAHFGLSIAAIGFIVACLVGVLHINIMKRRGKIIIKKESPGFVYHEQISSPNEIPLTESVDKFSIQIVLILLVYFITFLFMDGLFRLTGANIVTDLIWGFNFILGTIFAILIKQLFKFFKKINVMTHDYPNNYLLNRISGSLFDFMIISGIAAIEIGVLKSLIAPLVLICVIGTIVTYFYVLKTTRYLFPEYSEEAFLSLFGMLTGTASTGMILLREVDKNFETPAADNLIYQTFYAIAFGFPIMLLIGYAPQGLKQSLITLGVLAVMAVGFNIALFRRKIFRKKVRKE